MNIYCISILPQVYDSFLGSSLIKRAQQSGLISVTVVNPRDFCHDKHQQVDDQIYGGGPGLLIKAKPVIDAIDFVVQTKFPKKLKKSEWAIIYVAPSEIEFTQRIAITVSQRKHLIFVSGRYEGIDYRFEQLMTKKYPDNFAKVSLGKFITMGGEAPSMVMIEAITRLLPGVLHDSTSTHDESYSLEHDLTNLEYPQYTRPEELLGMKVPAVLLSGNHAQIAHRKKTNQTITKA